MRGELRPGGSEREWCDPDVLRRLRRASLAALRREVEPVEREALARFLPSWHGIDRRASLREALVPLQALALAGGPVGVASCCRAASLATGPSTSTRCARAARSSGSAPGSTAWRSTSARTRPCSAASPARRGPRARQHDRIRAALERGALFWLDLLDETGLADEEALPALWDLVWAGEVTNDAWTPLRAGRRFGVPKPERRPRRFSRRRASGATATQGRWSRTERLFAGAEPERRALAELLLERQGIVTRDGVRAEGIPGGYGAVYAELRALETLGLCRRGYFVEGLGGAQFALGGAVERLRELRERDEDAVPLVLAAADPAQPYGASLPWPKRAGARAARVAGAYVVLIDGEAVLYVERGGRRSSRCAIPTRPGCAPRSARSSTTSARAASSAWPSSASTASRSRRPTRCRCSSRPASSPGRAARCCGRDPRHRVSDDQHNTPGHHPLCVRKRPRRRLRVHRSSRRCQCAAVRLPQSRSQRPRRS